MLGEEVKNPINLSLSYTNDGGGRELKPYMELAFLPLETLS